MKISLSNPGFWLCCLFEFIFLAMHMFYYGNATVGKNSLRWKSNGFLWKEEGKREGGGTGSTKCH